MSCRPNLLTGSDAWLTLLRARSAAWPDEATFTQPMRGQPDAGAVVNQYLQPSRSAVGKDVGVVQPNGTEDHHDIRHRDVRSGAHLYWLGREKFGPPVARDPLCPAGRGAGMGTAIWGVKRDVSTSTIAARPVIAAGFEASGDRRRARLDLGSGRCQDISTDSQLSDCAALVPAVRQRELAPSCRFPTPS